MSDDDITTIGRRIGYGGTSTSEFGIRRADRRSHLYAIGKTGTGKSTLLERLILQDIAYGEGVAFLDPHGGHAEKILDFIPPSRTDDLCYFNPADLAHPSGFNPFESVPADRRHLAVSGFVGACKAIWQDSWGASMDYIRGSRRYMSRPSLYRSLLRLLRGLRWILKPDPPSHLRGSKAMSSLIRDCDGSRRRKSTPRLPSRSSSIRATRT